MLKTRLFSNFAFPVTIVSLSKIFTLLVIPLLSTIFIPNSRPKNLDFLNSWNIWDAPHYLFIAEHGYQTWGDEANFIVFFPLYPLFISLAHNLLHLDMLLSGYLITSIFTFLSGIVFYNFLNLHYSLKIARLSLLYLFLFPTAFFLHLPYTESLFFFLTILVFHFIHKKQFLPVVFFSCLATAARMQGLALALAVTFSLLARPHASTLKRISSLPLCFLAFGGFIAYLFINQTIYHNFLHFTFVQETHWHNSFNLLGIGFQESLKSIFWRNPLEAFTVGYSQVAAAFISLVTIFYSFFKQRKEVTIYCAVITFMIFTSTFWLSTPRYILVLFPFYILLAQISKNWLVILSISGTLFFFQVVFSLLAINYGPVF